MQKKDFIIPISIILFVLVVGAVLIWRSDSGSSATASGQDLASTTDSTASSTISSSSVQTAAQAARYYPYGTVTLALNQVAGFKSGLSMRPLSVVEDSRCPSGVQCIQAGTVRLMMKINTGASSGTQEIALGKSVTTASEKITLVSVAPLKTKDASIAQASYIFTFSVEPLSSDSSAGTVSKPCVIGGCSAEICSDESTVSTCMYRAEYGCYRTASCTRQSNGKCGWTETKELKACLANPPA